MILRTRQWRKRASPIDLGMVRYEAWYVDRPADAASWTANCRRLAAEANAEHLFTNPIDPTLVSLICHERLQPPPGEEAAR